MPLIVRQKTVTIGADQYQTRDTIQANAGLPFDLQVPAAKVGSLTTRTDNTNGTLTMNSGHGFNTADKIDIFWTDPTTGLLQTRYQVTCGTVATNSVPISGGSGNNLPLNNTAITAMKPTTLSVSINGSNVVGIGAKSIYGGNVVISAGSTVLVAYNLRPDRQSDSYNSVDLATPPTNGQSITLISVSHPDSTATRTVSGEILFN